MKPPKPSLTPYPTTFLPCDLPHKQHPSLLWPSRRGQRRMSTAMRPQSLRTLNDIFFAIAERNQPRLMLQRQGDVWTPISSAEFCSKVHSVARALCEWTIARGDRVAILSENRPEWSITDFACLALGAVVVPLYATLTGEQSAYILRDSGTR